METILLIEKESTLRILYNEELKEEGYRILLAENEKEALKILKGKIINLIITDHHLLQERSYMALVHTANKVKGIPVIIHTDYSCNPMDFTSRKNIEYIIKSSNLDNLKSKMRKMLDYKSLARVSQAISNFKRGGENDYKERIQKYKE